MLTQFLAVGTDAGVPAEVRILGDDDQNGTYETETTDLEAFNFNPFPGFNGGARVAFGDFNGDGNDELVVAAGPGGGPHVLIYELTSGGLPGAVLDSFFTYNAGFAGGVFVAAGDINGDGRDELITAPDAGGGPHVKVFSDTNGDGRVSDNLVDEFFPYGGFTGGVRLAAGDVDNDGSDDIITATGPGGGPHVIVFQDTDGDLAVSDNPMLDQFFAYSPGFSGGVYVASTDHISGAGGTGAEIITGPGAGGGPHVRIFTDTNDNGLVSDDPTFEELFAYDPGFTGGVRVAAGDTDNSGTFVEVMTVPGPGGGAHLKIFDDDGDAGDLISDNPLDDQRFPFPANITTGFFVATGRANTSQFAFVGPEAIPDQGDAGDPLTVSIFVPPSADIIRDLNVHLSIEHQFNADLDVTLLHVPSGTSLTLFTDIGNNDDGLFIILSDEAGTDIGDAPDDPDDQPVTGSFNPEGAASLSDFDNLDASGEWRLTIDDDAGALAGTLLSWILDFDHD